jgi:hypothetical protein
LGFSSSFRFGAKVFSTRADEITGYLLFATIKQGNLKKANRLKGRDAKPLA